jgi:hypothetical protein
LLAISGINAPLTTENMETTFAHNLGNEGASAGGIAEKRVRVKSMKRDLFGPGDGFHLSAIALRETE